MPAGKRRRKPAFAVQARPGFANPAGQPMAPHVQAAVQRNAPPRSTVQRQATPQTVATPAQPRVRGNTLQVPPAFDLSAAGPGQALPPAVQRKMEAATCLLGTSTRQRRP